MAYGGSVSYVYTWLHHAHQTDDTIFRLYVSLFLLDLMSEYGQIFNGNERPSTPDARAALCGAFGGISASFDDVKFSRSGGSATVETRKARSVCYIIIAASIRFGGLRH
jgi:hypothetical protein